MQNITEEMRNHLLELLSSGKVIPHEYKYLLFPSDRKECELVYAGKDREEDVIGDTMALPLQPVKTFGYPAADEDWTNMLIFGDNLQSMKTLWQMKQQGKLVNADGTEGIKLVYIDPPFSTKQDFKGSREQKAYQDKIVGAQFLEFLRRRLILIRELLSPDATVYVHMDLRKIHYIKVLMDEIFGENNFLCEIVWKSTSAHSDAKRVGQIHQTILVYTCGSNWTWNTQYVPYGEDYKKKYYRYKDPDGREWKSGDLTAPGGRGPVYEWNGITRAWRVTEDNMRNLENLGKIFYTKNGIPRLKQYWDDIADRGGMPTQSIWDDREVQTVVSWSEEGVGYPTQKSEGLLARIIRQSSNEGDLILDAFAGSGTTLAVAEKLNRRWIGIDCGKLSIYTIQKRLLNLKLEIGNKGFNLTPNPFTVYNAGLYDFSTLKALPWSDYRFFALNLFQCRDEPHSISGVRLDGYRGGADVLVFNHQQAGGVFLDYGFIDEIHNLIGSKTGSQFFIIASAASVAFLEDYLDREGVRYYILRIPYSIINELHDRDFEAITQPLDESQINATVEAVGFDFIRAPEVHCEYFLETTTKGSRHAVIRITDFRTEATIKGAKQIDHFDALSMVLVDLNYNGEVFNLDEAFYAEELKQLNWEVRLKANNIGNQIMIMYMDIFGNERREVKALSDFTHRMTSLQGREVKG